MEKQKQINPTDHHLLFYDKEWSLREEARWLRERAGLRVDLYRSEHDEMHRRVALVPVMGVHALLRVASDYTPSQSLYTNIDNFMLLTERAHRNPKCHEIERSLGALTVQAMQMQRDFIVETKGKNAQISRKQKEAFYA